MGEGVAPVQPPVTRVKDLGQAVKPKLVFVVEGQAGLHACAHVWLNSTNE